MRCREVLLLTAGLCLIGLAIAAAIVREAEGKAVTAKEHGIPASEVPPRAWKVANDTVFRGWNA